MRRPAITVVFITALALPLAAQAPPRSASAPASPVRLTGRVLADGSATPLAKARVFVTPVAPGAAVTLSDSDGRFALTVPSLPVTLTIDKTGYAPNRATVTSLLPLDVHLQRGAAVEGRVLDEFGEPAVGLPVRLRSSSTPPLVRTAGTDDRGEFRIGGLPAGTFSISVLAIGNSSNGFTDVGTKAVTLAPGDTSTDVDFLVPAGASNRGITPPALLVGSARPTGTGTIRGVVMTTDGRPLAHAGVSMFARRPGGAASSSVLSDANGRFAFQDVPPGTVQVYAMKGGYESPSPVSGRAVTVENGRVIDVQLLFDPIGAVAGVVSDEDGEPLQGVRVQALQVRFERGARRLVPASDYCETDDLGRYRLFGLVPGQYIVSAAAIDAASGGLPDYGRSYYPGTPEASQAQFVDVASSDSVAGIDLWLPRARTFRVSGRLLDSSGLPSTGGSVSLVPSVRSAEAAMVPIGARIGQDGTFEFANVMPGQYVVHADRGRKGRATEGEFGSLAVAVTDRDVTGLVVQTSPGSTITGRIVLDSAAGAKLSSVGGIDIVPVPVDFDAAPRQQAVADIRDDGVFIMQGINGARRIEVTRVPAGWSLKEVRSGGIDVTDRPLQFGRREQSLSGVEIVLTDRVTGVAGSVEDANGQPAQNTVVVMFATDRDRRYAGSRYMAAADVSSSGAFSVSGLPAGSYYVVAIPHPRSSDPDGWQDPQMLESYTRAAQSIVIRDGSTTNINLRQSVP